GGADRTGADDTRRGTGVGYGIVHVTVRVGILAAPSREGADAIDDTAVGARARNGVDVARIVLRPADQAHGRPLPDRHVDEALGRPAGPPVVDLVALDREVA